MGNSKIISDKIMANLKLALAYASADYKTEDLKAFNSAIEYIQVLEEKFKGFECALTHRDYFAGQALLGLRSVGSRDDEKVAKRAYEIADAIIKEKNKNE